MKKKIIIISIILAVALIVCGCFLLLGNGGKGKENNDKKDINNKPVTKEEIIITFDSDGGSNVENIKIEKGKTTVLPTTTKEKHSFLGWYLDEEKITEEYVFEKDTTLKAKWEEIKEDVKTFIVTFNSNGGSSINKLTIECGKLLPALSKPTKNGYTFVSWADKNGKVISGGAKLSCENITLYANWEKVETKTETKTETKKTYTCPDGYYLDGTKCKISKEPSKVCPSGTKVDGDLCIRTSDVNAGTRQCKEDTVSIDGKGHTWTGRGDYYYIPNAYGKCAYYKWSSITNESDCIQNINRKAVWVSQLNGCYAETKMNNYETICDNSYKYYSSDELSSKFGIHDNGKCLKKVDKEEICDTANGYVLTAGSCIKTIDATIK